MRANLPCGLFKEFRAQHPVSLPARAFDMCEKGPPLRASDESEGGKKMV